MDQGKDTQEELLSHKPNLDEVMEKIRHNTNSISEESVDFFKDSANDQAKAEEEKKKENAVNVVYDGLMLTLNEIGEYAVTKAKRNTSSAKEYEVVARTLEPMTHITRALADDRVPLVRNKSREAHHASNQDTIYAYHAHNFNLDDTPYKAVKIFIRPNLYRQPIEVRNKNRGRSLEVSEIAQPRMTISILPENADDGEISIRVDREDARRDYQITYDIVVNSHGHDIMQELNFSGENPQQIQTGQREGHHFSSNWTAEALGVSFSDILETFNKKFASRQEQTSPENPIKMQLP